MTRPLILVTADVKQIDGYRWHAAPSTYLRAVVSGSNGIPVLLPSLGAEIVLDDVLNEVDGVVATGSRSNVNPELYGKMPTEENGPYDPDRDATTLPLLRRAVERGIPVFAICRGMQELNVAMGGTLLTEIQTLEGRKDHRAPTSDSQDERFRIAHPIDITKGSHLAEILGETTVEVNSLHRQALGQLGPSVIVEATAEDGTIEAVSVKDAPGYIIATQWHPEYWVHSDTPSKRLFEAFGEAATAYKKNKLTAKR
ncbi:putative glutamine amidotransferase [Roseibium hamelinense]|uniref:gamma-glutamyl-gamma-aminobutyrate hydrolase n=1 Tax=Roseibium hamelinense TaxID=150831 RepID=A0A562SNR4_9HYPH|nr:gamma-glutamyl-gamma-aminobutyrate hydrolase family protein [Roseibium hamelinense]MTI45062.1 gamma-glutamyl-gamma-aminobutyrate hydrolase family protein [Roseibium hamelinense]TWI82326.1 putative glutamine amidotransferase [Roseibium hamelinense]